jgi:hypothetical protein
MQALLLEAKRLQEQQETLVLMAKQLLKKNAKLRRARRRVKSR